MAYKSVLALNYGFDSRAVSFLYIYPQGSARRPSLHPGLYAHTRFARWSTPKARERLTQRRLDSLAVRAFNHKSFESADCCLIRNSVYL